MQKYIVVVWYSNCEEESYLKKCSLNLAFTMNQLNNSRQVSFFQGISTWELCDNLKAVP